MKPFSLLAIASPCAASASARACFALVRGVPWPPDGSGVSSSSCAVADARSSSASARAQSVARATYGCFAMRASSFAMSCRREHEIHAARRHRAARHRVVSGRIVLRERDPALGLDRLQSQRAVGRRAGKHHADGPLALVLRQRLEKEIDRSMRRARLSAAAESLSTPSAMLRLVSGGMT